MAGKGGREGKAASRISTGEQRRLDTHPLHALVVTVAACKKREKEEKGHEHAAARHVRWYVKLDVKCGWRMPQRAKVANPPGNQAQEQSGRPHWFPENKRRAARAFLRALRSTYIRGRRQRPINRPVKKIGRGSGRRRRGPRLSSKTKGVSSSFYRVYVL